MLRHRSSEKELHDLGPDHYTPAEFKHCQKMLFRVNRLLGCFHETVSIIKRLPSKTAIMDVGCGAGLFLLHLSRLFPNTHFHGVDISAEAIAMAVEEKSKFVTESENVTFELVCQPELNYKENSFDIILANMVCHHMSDQKLVIFFKQAMLTAKHRIIINDLHRHSIAY